MTDSLKYFIELFEGGNIHTEKIKTMFSFPEKKYDKITAVCMAAIIAAVFNPLMIAAFVIIRGNIFYLVFLLAMIGYFVYCFAVKKKFSLIGAGIIAALKFFPFHEASSDTLIAVAAVILVYLLCSMEFSGR